MALLGRRRLHWVRFCILAALASYLLVPTAQAADLNLARGGTATATSIEHSTMGPERAIDGRRATRWASELGSTVPTTQRWQVDLGASNPVDRVVVRWEMAYARDYAVQTSPDGTTWTTQATVRGATSALTRTHRFTAVTARHVRLEMTAKGTQWGYSFWEVRIYGPPPPTTGTPETTITSGPAGITTSTQPAFSFGSDAVGSSFECQVDSAAYAACSSPYTVPAQRHGDHTFSVRANDGAGTVDQTPASRSFTVVGPEAGRSQFFNEAPTNFDHWVRPASGSCLPFFSRYDRMRVYPPYADPCVAAGYQGALGYQDIQAIYKDANGAPQLPQWVLKDASGRNLYVPFACGGGTCPLYAADIGNQAFRDSYIDQIRAWLPMGYAGIFVDDVNWNLNVSDGNATPTLPVDPRTGAAMTLANWKTYLADFLEQIRAAFPDVEIMINSVWWKPESSLDDPTVLRGVGTATHYELERGTTDVFNGQSWEGMLDFINRLQTYGVDVNFDNYYATTRQQAEFEMATYFLVSTGRDTYSAEYRSCPDNASPSPCSEPWWPAYATDLGLPTANYTVNGTIYRRPFANGLVLINKPGGASQTLPLDGSYRDLDGNALTSVTLGAGQAIVLQR